MNFSARSSLLLLVIFSATTYAEQIISGNYWRCTSLDGANKRWAAISIYRKIALNFAFSSCKKESALPASCRIALTSCEEFIEGVNIKSMWRCTALDKTATPWRSNLYSQRDDAALAAKAYCQQKSFLPGSCYINLITCVNLHGFKN
ncbi:hypothetical protein [Legionella sp.]|uniref:hypothetical protein n=1 Tax=Legionella sp. TaxID=459 RepID=UPI003C80A5D2